MKRYETFLKINGRYKFQGWYHMMNEDFCIDTKQRGNYTYKTYKWLNGEIETYKYGECCES